jgi:hypothetical protein
MEHKRHLKSISTLSDDELLRRLSELLHQSRRVESELVAHIGEVDQRRLYARCASSMFRYCVEALHLSEHEAYLRIEVARASRKHPVLLEMLADGRLHLSGIAILHRHLTDANREKLLKRAAYKSKRQIEELVAELCPKPDVPARMRKLPERPAKTRPQTDRAQLGPDRAERSTSEFETTVATLPAPAPARPAVVKPLAAARYKVEFTASAKLRDKLERLRALMRSSVPDGDLATIIEEAVTEKLERLESKRFAKTKAPRKSLEETDMSPRSRTIPAAVKRAVRTRDLGQCTFKDNAGRRCTERHRLEFHHRKPYGRGGDHSPDNIELRCKAHNLYQAERDYDKEVIEQYRRSSSRVSERAAVYTLSNRATRARRVAPATASPAAVPWLSEKTQAFAAYIR